jgi:hypothetical protein
MPVRPPDQPQRLQVKPVRAARVTPVGVAVKPRGARPLLLGLGLEPAVAVQRPEVDVLLFEEPGE